VGQRLEDLGVHQNIPRAVPTAAPRLTIIPSEATTMTATVESCPASSEWIRRPCGVVVNAVMFCSFLASLRCRPI
jgi:hypothetical protein